MRGLGRSHGFNYFPEVTSGELSGLNQPIDTQTPMLEIQAASAEECFTFINGITFYPERGELRNGAEVRNLLSSATSILRMLVTEPTRNFTWPDLAGCLPEEIRQNSDDSQRIAVRGYICQLRDTFRPHQAILVSPAHGHTLARYRFNKDFLQAAPSSWDLLGLDVPVSTFGHHVESVGKCFRFKDALSFYPETMELRCGKSIQTLNESDSKLLERLVTEPDREYRWMELAECLSNKIRQNTEHVQRQAISKCIHRLRKAAGSRQFILSDRVSKEWREPGSYWFNKDLLLATPGTSSQHQFANSLQPPARAVSAVTCFGFIGDVTFYPERREVWRGQDIQELNPNDCAMLEMFVTEPDRQFQWRELVDCLSNKTRQNDDRAQRAGVSACVRRLRLALGSQEAIQCIGARKEGFFYQFNKSFLQATPTG